MKRGSMILCALYLSLAACSTMQVQTAQQIAEKADTEALSTYAAIGTALNAFEAANPSQTTAAEKFRAQAWSDLMVINTAYEAGKAIDLTTLNADLTNAQKGQIQ